MSRRTTMTLLGCALVGALLVGGGVASAQTVRAIMHAEVKFLDPHWTTADITRLHGYMVYDTLFALDAKGQPQPQMVDTYQLSGDKLTYTFTLRDGLKWHDGKPVRAADAVASIKRWAVKDAAGQKLMARTASLEATGDKTFVLKLKEPYGLTIRALAKEYSYVPFILPAQHAAQDPSKAFEGDPIGSGPFMFAAKEWVPGAKTVYLKFKDYRPPQGAGKLLRRRQEGERGPGGVRGHPRSIHRRGGAGEGRGGLPATPAHGPVAAAPEERQYRHVPGGRGADADPPEPPEPPLRQRQGPAGPHADGEPGGLPPGHRRRSAELPRLP